MDYLEKYLGLVFLLAGGHRVFLDDQRINERDNVFGLPMHCDLLIIAVELFVGTILLFDLKYKYETLIILFLFLTVGTIIITLNNFNNIVNTYLDVFTYQPTFTSVVLHLAYIVMIGTLLIEYKKKEQYL